MQNVVRGIGYIAGFVKTHPALCAGAYLGACFVAGVVRGLRKEGVI